MVQLALNRLRRNGSYRIWRRGTMLAVVIVVVAAVVGFGGFRRGGDAPSAPAGMTLVGSDDFDGPAGSAPSTDLWDYDLGGGGWGNREAQVYTRSPDNARLDGRGHLLIEARRNGNSFTSARLVTRGKATFRFGLLEVRAKLPEGQGLHPAVWLLGDNLTSVGYPQCGEIDIVELVNRGTAFHNAIHGPMAAAPATQWKQSADGELGFNLSRDFHVFQVRRAPGQIEIGIDGVVVGRYSNETKPPGTQWVFDDPMFLILNVAVGGEWPGPVATDTAFPATMEVDWIRLWH